MQLLNLWAQSPDLIQSKQVQQLVAFAGNGKLLDDTPCSLEFREFLARVPSENLAAYSEQCLEKSFFDSGMVLQDVVNTIGDRLGGSVTFGRYRGSSKHLGFDGLWEFTGKHSIVVEVKTTDAYRIDLNTIAEYRRGLVETSVITEANSSILLVVGRQDTGDLEAQIRGSRHAWDIRIISVDALLRLMRIKEELEDPTIVQRIHNILIPREFTRLDEIVDVLFSAAEDIRRDDAGGGIEEPVDGSSDVNQKERPVAFHAACLRRVEKHLRVELVRRSRCGYLSPDHKVAVSCSVSKEYDAAHHPNYWFAFHPHQQVFLEKHEQGFVALGCGSSDRLILVPLAEFKPMLASTWTTTAEDRTYWHITIHRNGSNYSLRQKKGYKAVDLTRYVLPPEM